MKDKQVRNPCKSLSNCLIVAGLCQKHASGANWGENVVYMLFCSKLVNVRMNGRLGKNRDYQMSVRRFKSRDEFTSVVATVAHTYWSGTYLLGYSRHLVISFFRSLSSLASDHHRVRWTGNVARVIVPIKRNIYIRLKWELGDQAEPINIFYIKSTFERKLEHYSQARPPLTYPTSFYLMHYSVYFLDKIPRSKPCFYLKPYFW